MNLRVALTLFVASTPRPDAGVAHVPRYVAAQFLEASRRIRITAEGGTSFDAPQQPGQVESSRPVVSPDKTLVAWTTQQPNCCTSYDIPTGLVVYGAGRILYTLRFEAMIWRWQFANDGNTIALTIGPTHGNPEAYELHDASTGRLLERYPLYDDRPPGGFPSWVSLVRAKSDDPLELSWDEHGVLQLPRPVDGGR
jgi:hypothetical protein